MKETTREKHYVRLLNPSRPIKHLVRVFNPGMREPLLKAKSDEGAEKLFRNFRGREPKSIRMMEAKRGTPSTVAELGGLVELTLHDSENLSEKRANMKVVNALKLRASQDEDGDQILKFNPARIKLVSDGNGDMHITGFYKSLPEGMERGRSYFLGGVLAVVYKADKLHIETGEQEYEHFFAERGGELPRLFYKDGYLFFRGGTYSITRGGIAG
jgi:hypothetical protein